MDDICFDIFKLFVSIYYIQDMRYMGYLSINCISTIMYVYVFDQHDFVL